MTSWASRSTSGRTWRARPRTPPRTPAAASGAVEDARRVADRLGIQYYVMNFRDTFEEKVIKDFVGEYARGRTPNPCVRCNQYIKFDALLARAAQFDADYVATGHYVRVEQDADQRALAAAQGGRPEQGPVVRPVRDDPGPAGAGALSARRAEQGRDPQAGRGLAPARRQQAREPGHLLRAVQAVHRVPGAARPGDAPGRRRSSTPAAPQVGTHQGIALHTVGQRRGLGLATREPRYVTSLDSATNTVMIGAPGRPAQARVRAGRRQLGQAGRADRAARAPTRGSATAPSWCRRRSTPSPALGRGVVFDEPQRAVTPGQAVVFYDGEYVVGGGTIDR